MEALKHFAHAVAPYFLVELLLPGGSIVALLLYLHRRGATGARS